MNITVLYNEYYLHISRAGQTVIEQLGRMCERFGPVEGSGHLQVSPEIMPIASGQLPHRLYWWRACKFGICDHVAADVIVPMFACVPAQ